jgi:hypothetical protein
LAIGALALVLVGVLLVVTAQALRSTTSVPSIEAVAKIFGQPVAVESLAAISAPQMPQSAGLVQAAVSSGAMKAGAAMQLVNGMSVELTGIKRDGDSVLADICFQLPSSADWQLASNADDVVLTANNQSFIIAASHLIDWQTSAAGVKTKRCDELSFVVPASVDLSKVVLTVKRLVTSTPEAIDCAGIQNKLTSTGTGIVIKCAPIDSGMSITIVQKPDTLSEGGASRLLDDAAKEIVPGPWVFETSVP